MSKSQDDAAFREAAEGLVRNREMTERNDKWLQSARERGDSTQELYEENAASLKRAGRRDGGELSR